jgi:hypothetical protein
VLIFVTVVVLGAPPVASAGAGDSVAGAGSYGPTNQYGFEAFATDDGTASQGFLVLGDPDAGEWSGEVVCVTAVGNEAIVGAFNAGNPDYPYATITLVDDPTGDTASPATFSAREPRCDSPNFRQQYLLAGQVTVIDGEPGPTSPADCANGGYQQYGFNSEGQCRASFRGSRRRRFH